MNLSVLNCNLSNINAVKYYKISFGRNNQNTNNQQDSVEIKSGKLNCPYTQEQEKISKLCRLISSNAQEIEATKRTKKFTVAQADTAIKKGYEGEKLADFTFAISLGMEDEEAQLYTDNNLKRFYSEYEEEFKESPYFYKPSYILTYMGNNNLSITETQYALGLKMDDETLRKYKLFLSVIKKDNSELEKKYVKATAQEAVKSANREKEARRKQLAKYLTETKKIPGDIAQAISKSPVLTARTEVIKALFPANENSPKYPIKPAKSINKRDMMTIVSNPIIINNFDRFVGLISIDKTTEKPVSKKLRALDLNEAYEVVKSQLPNSQLNDFIFFCNCGIKPYKAVRMLTEENI